MKKMIKLLAVAAALASLGLSAVVNGASGAAEVSQDPCSVETKTAVYGLFYKEIKGDQAKAYEAAKKYIACPSDSADEAETKRVQYLKDFIAKYEKAQRKNQVIGLIYDKNDFAKGFEVGRQVLADDPENLRALIALGYAGYLASAGKNTSFNTEAIGYAKKAIQMLEAGKTVDSWLPFTGKDEALSYMNYAIAVMTYSSAPEGSAALTQNASDALPYFIKSAQLEGKLKKHPLTYGYIAGAYENGPYAKLSAEYKAKYEGKDESPESKLALANINQVIDRMVDAYARAVALAGSDKQYEASKTAWLEGLTSWYKYRNNQSDAGLTEVIASVLSKPLPSEPTPITTLPASTPASGTTGAPQTAATPAGNTGTSGNPSTTNPTGPKSTTTPASTAPSTKPQPTPTPAPKPSSPTKPKFKRNHRA
jgi:hypothetical protein